MLTYLPSLFSLASLLLVFYLVTRKEAREDGQTTAQRLKKAEGAIANQEARQQGFQAEIEAVADYGKREREALADAHRRDYETLKEQIKDVPSMRDLLSRMVERMENFGKTVDKLDGKTDRIVELLTHK